MTLDVVTHIHYATSDRDCHPFIPHPVHEHSRKVHYKSVFRLLTYGIPSLYRNLTS
jgi:hypothetical protein